jgi:hypothetical protein
VKHYSKEDVETHSTSHYGPGLPAVNVKVRGDWRRVTLPLELGSVDGVPMRTDPLFSREWVESLASDTQESAWNTVCESGIESLIEDAREVLGPGVKVWQAGRSGGWLVVEGLPRLESWDAIALGKWRKWERYCRLAADDIPRAFLDSLYFNVFLPMLEETNVQAGAGIRCAQ